MIVEERMYTLHVGKLREFMETRVMRPPAFFEPILRAMLKAGTP